MPTNLSSYLRLAWCRLALMAILALFLAVPIRSAEDKRLAVYAPGKSYSVQVIDSDKIEYVTLSEVLQPLGKLKLRSDGRTLFVSLNDVEGEFAEGKKLARVGKVELLLPAKAIVDKGRMLIPLRALTKIMQRYLRQEVDLHEQGRRLFVGGAGESFTIEIKRPENSLLLTFPAAVSPAVTNDGGKMHLSFAHDPVVFGAESFVYNDKVITAVNLTERNGAAEIVVSGTTPLVASVQDGGKAISVTAAPVAVVAAPVAPAAQPPVALPPQPAAADKAVVVQKAAASGNPLPFFVMIDPSHGGDDPGVRFSGTLFEKDITLAVARKLRTELHNRGVAAVLLRDSDATLSYDQRAVSANAQRAAIYVTIHAGNPGRGVRVYTAMLGPGGAAQETKKSIGSFVPWEHAQQPQLDKSRLLANAIVTEMTAARIVSGSTSAPLLPLNSIAAPAVAVEIAPISIDATPDSMNSPKYQQAIVSAMASAIVNTRAKIEARP